MRIFFIYSFFHSFCLLVILRPCQCLPMSLAFHPLSIQCVYGVTLIFSFAHSMLCIPILIWNTVHAFNSVGQSVSRFPFILSCNGSLLDSRDTFQVCIYSTMDNCCFPHLFIPFPKTRKVLFLVARE